MLMTTNDGAQVVWNEDKGRHGVATRDVAPGEVGYQIPALGGKYIDTHSPECHNSPSQLLKYHQGNSRKKQTNALATIQRNIPTPLEVLVLLVVVQTHHALGRVDVSML